MSWPQAWTRSAQDVDRHLAVLMGGLFVGQSWQFGDVVELAHVAITTPTLGSVGVSIPTLGNVTIEV